MSLWGGLTGAVFAYMRNPKISVRVGWTGYKTMKNLPKLITAVLEAYENPAFAPVVKDGKIVETFCNEAVQRVASKMGCEDFARMTADEICQFLAQKKGWQEVLMRDCQFLANQGTLVIAGLPAQTLGGAHGHVCVVRPGEQVWSEHWKSMVPAVMNIGGQNFILRFKMASGEVIEAGVNGAFQMIPRFYAWEASL